MLHCSGEKISRIDCGDASLEDIKAFLSHPPRIVRALLDSQQLEGLGQHRYLYASRPYRLLTFEIQPRVLFAVEWDDKQLQIVFENCEIAGLGDVEKSVCFSCEAIMRPVVGGIEAAATAHLNFKKTVLTAFLPDAVWLGLGNKALNLVFKRLDDRCQRRLRKSALRWLQRESRLV